MHLLENIREAFRSIQSNLLRTVLTALIVSIGIMSLVGILTAIDAIKSSLTNTFASLGANSFELRAKGYTNRFRRGGVQGRTESNKVVTCEAPAELIGYFVDVTLVSTTGATFTGELIPALAAA